MVMPFTEQKMLSELLELAKKYAQIEVLTEVTARGEKLPIYGLALGSQDRSLPTFGLFGGVHGLERVGSHVVINYLKTLIAQLQWDKDLNKLLERVRIVSIPIVNPGGMYLSARANPNGVDIMRNAPIDSEEKGVLLVSGHFVSSKLPWYRGNPEAMEKETLALIEFVRREMFNASFSFALDIHSGFGMRDRIWYPFAFSRKPLPHKKTVEQFITLVEKSLPFHVYKFEQQTDSYLINGDPWDLLYLEHLESTKDNGGRTFLPWCLEMGSWTWLKKNPAQLFSSLGLFNPILPHRYNRIMRRHRGLLDLFWRATLNSEAWADESEKLVTFTRTRAK